MADRGMIGEILLRFPRPTFRRDDGSFAIRYEDDVTVTRAGLGVIRDLLAQGIDPNEVEPGEVNRLVALLGDDAT